MSASAPVALASGSKAENALKRLKEGNERFLTAEHGSGDISPKRRLALKSGQEPYAVVLCCSDSRVMPEEIFSAGLGEIFVIRVAGNVAGDHEIGSIEYAVDHLGTRLVVVMGHESCGAVGAALKGAFEGFVGSLTREVKKAIGEETDPDKAAKANAKYARDRIAEAICADDDPDLKVISAFYNIEDGRVEFFE